LSPGESEHAFMHCSCTNNFLYFYWQILCKYKVLYKVATYFLVNDSNVYIPHVVCKCCMQIWWLIFLTNGYFQQKFHGYSLTFQPIIM
jgi:hypothetical protein